MAPLRLSTALSAAALAAAGLLGPARGSTRVSSNAAARSSPGDYSNGLNVVKRHEEEEEEYVTSFYRRVRDKRRGMFGSQLRHDEETERRENWDHSLDHYFDQLVPPSFERRSRAKASDSEEESSGSDSPCFEIEDPRHVRGGGVAAPRLARPKSSAAASAASMRHLHFVGEHGHPASAAASSTSWADRGEAVASEASTMQSERHHRGHSRVRSRSGHRRHRREPKGYQPPRQGLFGDDYEDIYHPGLAIEEGDGYPEHHLGLLRVPCSIAINSEEASLGHAPSHADRIAAVPVAAYVDTGAQVTIISASAAKRAGIYHLMDRRYSGRATGVGHCKVLGRIPARHVHFVLGCDDDDDDAEEGHGGSSGYGRGSNAVQMDGPALTVLEGTVTKGVDVLLGLDVLQDWEAEIKMGPEKSITVKKRRNRNDSPYVDGREAVVIPFASSRRGALPSGARRHSEGRPRSPTRKWVDDLDDLEDYSPGDSDVEADLDLLDQSGRFLPEDGAYAGQEAEEDFAGAVRIASCDEIDDDFFRDSDEEEELDGEVEVDLSGL